MLRTCALGLLAACAAPLAISATPLAASSDVVCKLAAGPGDSCVAKLTAGGLASCAGSLPLLRRVALFFGVFWKGCLLPFFQVI